MEELLLSGTSIIKSIFFNDNEYKKKPQYDHAFVHDITKSYREKVNKLANDSKTPKETNIIPPYFNQFNQSNIQYGPLAESDILIKDNIDQQFELQKINNKEPFSMGESSNIASFNNNIKTDNKLNRNLNPQESNGFEYMMEIFSGSSRHWNPKVEVLPFFDPSEFKITPNHLISSFQKDRIILPKSKQNERPFEPTKVAIGLNLDYNQQPTGHYDMYRPQYKDANDLRTKNNQKITFEDRPTAHPKQYTKRQIDPEVITRRPPKTLTNDVKNLVPNKAQVNKYANNGEFILNNNARTVDTAELSGPAHGIKQIGGLNREGDVVINRKIVHVEDIQGPKRNDNYNPNIITYDITENQRNTTNYNNTMPISNHNQGNIIYDPNDIPKETQQLNKYDLLGINSTTHPQSYNPNDIPKETQQLSKYELLGINSTTHPQSYNHNDIPKETQQLNKYDLLGINSTTQPQIYNPNDLPKETQQLNKYDLLGINSTTQPQIFNPNDLPKETLRQYNKEFNKMIKHMIGTFTSLSDVSKTTLRQILSTQTYEQILSSAQHNVYTNLPDKSKETLKNVLELCEFNNNLRSENGIYSNLQDISNNTLKEILVIMENNTNMGSAQKETYVNFQDNGRTTKKETLSNMELNTVINGLIGNITNLPDYAKNTLKEVSSCYQFNNNINNVVKGNVNINDTAKSTLKQISEQLEFNTNHKYEPRTYAMLSDKAKETFKEILSVMDTNVNMVKGDSKSYTNLSDTARKTIKELMTQYQLNNNIGGNIKGAYANIADEIRTTARNALTLLEFNNNVGSANKTVYTSLQDSAKDTKKALLTKKEFNNFTKLVIGTYGNLSDEVKKTIREILSVQQLNTVIKAVQSNSYVNISDEIKETLKQILTLQVFNTNMKNSNNIYSNIQDNAKETLKEILTLLEFNNNVNSLNKESYIQLMDTAKNTIKEFLDVQQFNNNVKTTNRDVAINFNDIARDTLKQMTLNENYVAHMNNSGKGTIQEEYEMPLTMKDINKYNDYNNPGNRNYKTKSQLDARNMYQNVAKEMIAKGVPPTLSGAKQIPTQTDIGHIEVKTKPNYEQINHGTLINNHIVDFSSTLPTKASYDERLYNEILGSLETNDYVNNVVMNKYYNNVY